MFRQELAHLPFFQTFADEQFDLLESIADVCPVRAGQVIFEQGQQANDLYVLLVGEVHIHYKPYDGAPLIVARITPGGVFGWSAVLARESYTSSAVAQTDGEAYRIPGDKLREACDCNPDGAVMVLESLTRVVTERLSATHEQILAMINQGIDVNGNCSKRMDVNV